MRSNMLQPRQPFANSSQPKKISLALEKGRLSSLYTVYSFFQRPKMWRTVFVSIFSSLLMFLSSSRSKYPSTTKTPYCAKVCRKSNRRGWDGSCVTSPCLSLSLLSYVIVNFESVDRYQRSRTILWNSSPAYSLLVLLVLKTHSTTFCHPRSTYLLST